MGFLLKNHAIEEVVIIPTCRFYISYFRLLFKKIINTFLWSEYFYPASDYIFYGRFKTNKVLSIFYRQYKLLIFFITYFVLQFRNRWRCALSIVALATDFYCILSSERKQSIEFLIILSNVINLHLIWVSNQLANSDDVIMKR